MPLSVPTMATFQFHPKEEEEEPFMHGDTPRGSASLVPDAFGDFFELDLMSWDETSTPQVFKLKQEEDAGIWEQREMAASLNLRLNHQDVLDAWSDRGPPWVFDHHGTQDYGGEVPNLEEEDERERRRARLLKYREKRQCRLFSKRIRYEVRKLNAEKRPRLKGRFVKGSPEKMPVR